MARICDVCSRGTQFGNTVSHSHRKQRRNWKVNLVKTRVGVLGSTERVSICTRCLRSGFVDKPVKRNYTKAS